MSVSERVGAVCPSCSPGEETVHEVLSSGGGLVTVRCTACGHVHKEEPPSENRVERRVVVSQEGESFAATVAAPRAETLRVGEEFVVDVPEAIMAVRITDLEVGDDRRTDEARVEEVETVWTRAVDNVAVNVTIHPSDGRRDETRSVEVSVPGDHEFAVGAVESFGADEFVVEGLVVREDAVGYPARKLDREGDAALAKDVSRVYGRDETSDAWSAW